MTLQSSADEPVYVASDIKPKRSRRTKAEVAAIRNTILDILEDDNPQTVRQVFYALTVRGVIAKAEIEYQRTVIRLLVEMREAGQIPCLKLSQRVNCARLCANASNAMLISDSLNFCGPQKSPSVNC
jgi:hypothetical protein